MTPCWRGALRQGICSSLCNCFVLTARQVAVLSPSPELFTRKAASCAACHASHVLRWHQRCAHQHCTSAVVFPLCFWAPGSDYCRIDVREREGYRLRISSRRALRTRPVPSSLHLSQNYVHGRGLPRPLSVLFLVVCLST